MSMLAISLILYATFICLFSSRYIVQTPMAILFMILALVFHHLLIIEILGHSKPYEIEGRSLEGSELIWYTTVGDSEIHVWIRVDGEPVAYVLEYSPKTLADIANAVEAWGAGRVRVKEIDPNGEDKGMAFHSKPPPPPEPKNDR